MNNKINQLHEGCLRIIYNDKHSNLEELLVKDSLVSVYHINIHSLVIEMYKIVNGICPEIMNDIFQIINNTHYNLRYAPTFLGEPIHSVFNGGESRSYRRDNDTGEGGGGWGGGGEGRWLCALFEN